MNIGHDRINIEDVFDFPKTVDKPKRCNTDKCWLFNILGTNENCRTQSRRGLKWKKNCRDSHRPDDFRESQVVVVRGGKVIKCGKNHTTWVDTCGINFEALRIGMPHYLKKLTK